MSLARCLLGKNEEEEEEEENRAEGPDPHLHYTVGMLQSVDMMKKRRTGHDRQGRREGPDSYLKYAVGMLQSVDIVVGHSNGFCQALLMTLDETLAESIICP